MPAAAAPMPPAPPRIAIIGGGLAGLTAAHYLHRAGLKAVIYEARSRMGGRVLSLRNAFSSDLIVDVGGSLVNTDHDDILELARRFELPLFNRARDAAHRRPAETAYFFEGRLRSEDEIAGALRPLAAQIAADAAKLDADFDTFGPHFDSQTVTAYLDANASAIGAPFVRRLVEATIRTEYGCEPDQSSALQLLFVLPSVDGQAVDVLSYSDEDFVFKGGSGQLVQSLVKRLPGQIVRGMRLTSVMKAHGRFRLTLAPEGNDLSMFGGPSVVDADYVLITVPFPVLRDVDLQVPLPRQLRQFIAEGNLGRNEKVIAGFARRSWRRVDGFVGELWSDLGFSEVWEETQRQPERPDSALTFFVGGREVAPIFDGDPQRAGKTFVDALDIALPGVRGAATGEALRSHWSRQRFTQGGYSTFAPGQLTRFAPYFWIEGDTPEESQHVAAGNLLFAGEHLSDAYYGFMNGAAQTGRLAAGVIVDRLRAAGYADAMVEG